MRKLLHRSWSWKRTEYIPGTTERAFADFWETTNKPSPGLNFGHGTLQDLLFKMTGSGITRRPFKVWWVSKREAMIVATVVQWLGTNCGMGFLREVLASCGLYIAKKNESFEDREYIEFEFSNLEWAVINAYRKNRKLMHWHELAAASGLTNHRFRITLEALTKLGFMTTVRRPAGLFYAPSELGEAAVESPNFEELKGGHFVWARFYCLKTKLPTLRDYCVIIPRSHSGPPESQIHPASSAWPGPGIGRV